MTTKEQVRALLDRLPEDCSLEDMQYHLYVIQAISQGEADEDAGHLIPHEQVAEELRRKWNSSFTTIDSCIEFTMIESSCQRDGAGGVRLIPGGRLSECAQQAPPPDQRPAGR